MVTDLLYVHVPLAESAETPSLRQVADEVRELLAQTQPTRRQLERRDHRRHPFPHLIQITPVDDNHRVVGPVVGGCCKDISLRGVGFFHPEPLPFRKVVVTFETRDQKEVAMVVVLSWCRFTRSGWYESGGRFLKVVPASDFASESSQTA